MEKRYEHSKNLLFKDASDQCRRQTGGSSQEAWEGVGNS